MGQNGETNPCHFLKDIKWHIQNQHILTSLRATWVKWWSFDSLYPFSSTSKQTLTTLSGWCLNTGQTIWMFSWWLWVHGYDSTRASNHFSLKQSPLTCLQGELSSALLLLRCCSTVSYVMTASSWIVCNPITAHPHPTLRINHLQLASSHR